MNDNVIPIFGYCLAFLMAFTSKHIDLSQQYGSYYSFIRTTLRTYMFCGVYGIIAIGAYWLYSANVKPDLVDTSQFNVNNDYIVFLLSAMLVGWSAKGFADTPLIPKSSSSGEDQTNSLKLSTIIDFLFKGNDDYFDLTIASKQKNLFHKYTSRFARDQYDQKAVVKKFYDFLEFHRGYGGGNDEGIAKFNSIISSLTNQPDIESSLKFAYQNLGYKNFKEALK